MLFNSIEFLIFFPLVIMFYFSIKHGYRWIILLIASYYFYMSWKAEYVILIFIATLINYYSALQIHKTNKKKKKKLYLWFSIISSLSILFAFKYFNFVNESIRDFLNLFAIQYDPFILGILLPVGISFYTFQAIGYTLDVYFNKIKPEKHFGIFALYVSFFPQLVAGPIERAKNLLPQFRKKYSFNYDDFVTGLKIMVWGFFLKLVIADRLAIIVNQVYNDVTSYTGLPLIIATYFFAFQIFCDFAGYSFIAIGSAKILGFNLMENFRRPYFARSVQEFWRRWHISLSTWFRDYIYFPLGGSRVKVSKMYFNLMIVFIVSGIWHGAAWTFIIWGFLHGSYLVFEHATASIRKKSKDLVFISKFPKLSDLISIFLTFHLVLLGWIFFRANSLSDALYVLNNMFIGSFDIIILSSNFGSITNILLSISFILILELIHFMQENNLFEKIYQKIPYSEWAYYYFLIFSILLFGVFENQQFIYFQF